MTTRITIAAALTIAFVSSLQFAPVIAESLNSAAAIGADHAAPMTASQKTRCIMPAAHWKGCGA